MKIDEKTVSMTGGFHDAVRLHRSECSDELANSSGRVRESIGTVAVH